MSNYTKAKGYCKEPYALIGHVRFCEGRKRRIRRKTNEKQ